MAITSVQRGMRRGISRPAAQFGAERSELPARPLLSRPRPPSNTNLQPCCTSCCASSRSSSSCGGAAWCGRGERQCGVRARATGCRQHMPSGAPIGLKPRTWVAQGKAASTGASSSHILRLPAGGGAGSGKAPHSLQPYESASEQVTRSAAHARLSSGRGAGKRHANRCQPARGAHPSPT